MKIVGWGPQRLLHDCTCNKHPAGKIHCCSNLCRLLVFAAPEGDTGTIVLVRHYPHVQSYARPLYPIAHGPLCLKDSVLQSRLRSTAGLSLAFVHHCLRNPGHVFDFLLLDPEWQHPVGYVFLMLTKCSHLPSRCCRGGTILCEER